jgi:crotonobetainyl-CoA:carnitine CoA-transferase CaiB-like acyl-CoA transferase
VQLFRTADGWIFVMCMTEKFWRALLDVLDDPELAADPAFVNAEARRRHRDQLTARLDAHFERRSTAQWLERLQGLLPAAPVNDLPQALENPFAHAVGMVRGLPHPARADFRVLANPIKLDGARLPSRPAPQLGEHTAALLREAGYDEAQIAALRDCGAA